MIISSHYYVCFHIIISSYVITSYYELRSLFKALFRKNNINEIYILYLICNITKFKFTLIKRDWNEQELNSHI